MPSIDFEIWYGSTITVSCPTCADRIAELENENDSLEQQIDSLYNDINTLKDDF
jgi:cell division protein FtsB